MEYTVRDFIRLKCWKIMPILRRAWRSSLGARAVSSWPFTKIRPEVGRSNRLIRRISVDLPAPL